MSFSCINQRLYLNPTQSFFQLCFRISRVTLPISCTGIAAQKPRSLHVRIRRVIFFSSVAKPIDCQENAPACTHVAALGNTYKQWLHTTHEKDRSLQPQRFLSSVKNVLYNKEMGWHTCIGYAFQKLKKRDFADNFTLSLHVVSVHIRVQLHAHNYIMCVLSECICYLHIHVHVVSRHYLFKQWLDAVQGTDYYCIYVRTRACGRLYKQLCVCYWLRVERFLLLCTTRRGKTHKLW